MITELTKEQEAKFPFYVDKWLKIGLSTAPVDFEKAKDAARLAYACAELKEPKNFYFAESPLAAIELISKLQPSWQRSQILEDMSYGFADAHFLSFYDYFWREFNIEICAKLEGLMKVAETSGFISFYDDTCVIQARPEIILFDELNRLHCETGPAIRFPDGFAVHAYQGTRIPSHWVEDRKNIDPNEIIKIDNVELRAIGATLAGWPKMLEVLEAKIIDDSGNDDIGQLIEMTLPGVESPGLFLKAVCPRNGIIVEGVPRISDIDNKPINTALAAQAFRIGDPQDDYVHPPRRT
jgi:hypothetical protein